MDIATTKLELIERLMSIWDEATLQRVSAFFKKEIPTDDDTDFTAEELAELDRRRARYLSGESKGYTIEESMKMLRAAQDKDEAA